MIFRVLIITMMMSLFSHANAGYAGHVTISHLWVYASEQADGSIQPTVFFGSSGSVPSDTCLYYNRAWKLDPSTPEGDALYKMLLSARLSGSTVNVWYHASSAPGKTHVTGCSVDNMARVVGISILN